MAREKKPVHKVQMTEGKRNIIHQLLEEYNIQTAEDIQEALKDLLGGTIREMMEAEMEHHPSYEKSERSDSDDYRNGYKPKRVNSSYGAMEIEVPQDRKSTFEPKVVRKPFFPYKYSRYTVNKPILLEKTSVILLQAQALQRSLSRTGNIDFSRFGFSLLGALQTVRRFHDRIGYRLYRNDFSGRKTEKNFSRL